MKEGVERALKVIEVLRRKLTDSSNKRSQNRLLDLSSRGYRMDDCNGVPVLRERVQRTGS
jgi:hypothetical protein